MEVAARDPWKELDHIERQMRALSARMLQVVGELDQEYPDDPDVPGLACDLAVHHSISSNSAWERIRIGRALRWLPHLRRAHAEGRLSWDQLRWLTRFVTPETDAAWSTRAVGMRPGALRLEAERQSRRRRQEAERDRTMRRARLQWDEDRRFLEMWVVLAAEDGAAAEAALKAAAQQIDPDPEAEDRRGARLADALVELLGSSGGRPSRPTVVVHADAEVLAGATDGTRRLAETSSGVQLTREAVLRMACEATVLLALERDGSPVGLVTARRGPTDRQREMLLFRDRHCTVPGCENDLFLHVHHIRHVEDGGKTVLDNLTLLCGTHHRKLHDGGWTIRGRPPDGLEFLNRHGRVVGRAGPVMARAG